MAISKTFQEIASNAGYPTKGNTSKEWKAINAAINAGVTIELAKINCVRIGYKDFKYNIKVSFMGKSLPIYSKYLSNNINELASCTIEAIINFKRACNFEINTDNFCTCTKCNGSGKVGFAYADGICFDCFGIGYIKTIKL